MTSVIQAIGASPVLAVIGLVVVLAVVLAPVALGIAGLTGAQIVELLKSTMVFVVEVIREIRSSNKAP